MKGTCTLILGGARSGKSRFALDIAANLGEKVLFVATAEAQDEEMRQKIEEHKRTRPSAWRTLEVPTGIGKAIRKEVGDSNVAIVDCLTLLVSNLLEDCGDPEQLDMNKARERVAKEIKELVECMDETDASFILVSNEVGLALVPDNQLGRVYRDLLGWCNQELAQRADQVYFMIAGLPTLVKGSGQASTPAD